MTGHSGPDFLPRATESHERHTVRSVERALDILIGLSRSGEDLGLTEIANRVGLHKSTVFRLLQSLEARGFARRSQTGDRYRLGWAVLELAHGLLRSDELASAALPIMTGLRDELGETVSLYVRDGIDRVRVQSVEGTQPIRRVAQIGQRFPLFVGASGKVLLAYADEDTKAEVLHGNVLPPDMDAATLARQLSEVRERGHAVSIEEREAGAAAVATPVFGRGGAVVAALAVSGPAERFSSDSVHRFAEAAKAAAQRISAINL